MSRTLFDSIDADPSDVRRFERTVDDQEVTVVVVDEKNDPRIIVEADRRYEMVVDDEWAYPRWEDPTPRWLESVVSDFGVRGIRTGVRGEK